MKILPLILALSVSCFGQAFYRDQMKPQLPKLWIDTSTLPTRTPSATKTLCASGCDYSTWVAMLAAVQKGWTVLASAAFVDQIGGGTTVTFPNLTSSCPTLASADWIIFKSTGTMPAIGTRVAPSGAQSGQFAVIEKNSGTDNEYPVAFATTAGCYWFEGIEVRYGSMTQTSDMAHALVAEGDGTDTTPATMVHDIVFSHSYVHGTTTSSIRRAFSWQGKYLALVDSECSEIHEFGADNQCIAGWNGTGPFKIVNNKLSAATEITLFGGSGVSVDPALYETNGDIEIRRNWYWVDPNWTYAVVGGPSGGSAVNAAGGSLGASTQYWYTAVAGPFSFAGSSVSGRRLCPNLNAGTCSYVTATTTGSNKTINVTLTTNATAPATSAWTLYRTHTDPSSVRWVASAWTAIAIVGAGGCTTQNTSCTLTDDGSTADNDTSIVADVGTSQWSLKNIMEFKDGKRVLMDGNVYENHVCCNQVNAIVFTPRKSGNNVYASNSDFTFTNNVIKNVAQGFNIVGRDDNGGMLSGGLQRVTIKNNLLVGIGKNVNNFSSTGNDSTLGRGIQIDQGNSLIYPPNFLVVDHNTVMTNPDANGSVSKMLLYVADSGDRFALTSITNNISDGQITGSGLGEGNATLTNSWPNLLTDYGTKAVSYNDFIGRSSVDYTNWTTGNRFDALANVGLTNPANCKSGADVVNGALTGTNCALNGGNAHNAASDGTDMGANLPAIVAAEAQVTYPH